VKLLLTDIISRLYRQEITPEQALQELQDFPYQDLGFAKIDHSREIRKGYPEVILAPVKPPSKL
jgi:NCAIR mutase (PurE)-related proteins